MKNIIKILGRNWFLLNVVMIAIGFMIVIYFDPLVELTHNVLKMFISFLGMIFIVVGNMGLMVAMVDHHRKKV
jgi:hypothetical protein